jgi:hypothetical protein
MGCPIVQGSAFDCTALKAGGIHPFMVLYNFEDWVAATKTLDVTDGFITDITNDSGIAGFDVTFADNSNILPNTALRAVEGGQDGFDHMIDAKLYDLTQASRNNIANVRFQKLVAIIYKNEGVGEVYGSDVGLRLSDFQYNPNDPAGGNNAQFVLKTPDGDSPETQLPLVILKTDAATTLTLIEGLSTAGV